MENNLLHFKGVLTIILSLLFVTVFAQNEVKVTVTDKQGNAVSNARLSVANSDFFTTDASGTYTYNVESPLKMPFKVKVKMDEYKLDEYALIDNQVKVVLNKIVREQQEVSTTKVVIRDELGKPVSNTRVSIDGKQYTTNDKGGFETSWEVKEPGSIKIEGFFYKEHDYDEATHSLVIQLETDSTVIDEILAKDSVLQSLQELDKVAFSVYKDEIQNISREIIAERKRMEDNNKRINEEIMRITERLETEQNLSPEQRKDLENYLSVLQTNLHESTEAFRRAQERTMVLVDKLSAIILEKEFTNERALERARKAEALLSATQEKMRRNILIFFIIVLTLLALAIIFYAIAVKLKKQKKSLREKNTQLDAFVYKASHDIKGPLKSIIGLTKVGAKDVKEEKAQEYFSHILQSTSRLENLITELLNLTKVQRAEVKKNPVDIEALIEEIRDSFKNFDGYDKISIKQAIEGSKELNTDKELLKSILQNLIENGIKYRDPKKESYLDITITNKNGQVKMMFKDNGLGIPEDQQEKIFDMFYKVNQDSDGTGLGLHIMKHAVEKLQGKIAVESKEGEGAAFTISI